MTDLEQWLLAECRNLAEAADAYRSQCNTQQRAAAAEALKNAPCGASPSGAMRVYFETRWLGARA